MKHEGDIESAITDFDFENIKTAESRVSRGEYLAALVIFQRFATLVGCGGNSGVGRWGAGACSKQPHQGSQRSEKWRESHPEAFWNILRRLLEANGRELCQAEMEKPEQLKMLHAETDQKSIWLNAYFPQPI